MKSFSVCVVVPVLVSDFGVQTAATGVRVRFDGGAGVTGGPRYRVTAGVRIPRLRGIETGRIGLVKCISHGGRAADFVDTC